MWRDFYLFFINFLAFEPLKIYFPLSVLCGEDGTEDLPGLKRRQRLGSDHRTPGAAALKENHLYKENKVRAREWAVP